MTEGIYLITCTATGDQYVGRSADLETRWKVHQKSLVRRKHQNSNIQALADKYGAESFTFEILEVCESCWDNEYKWMERLQPTLNGTGTKKSKVKRAELLRRLRALRETEPEFRRQQAIVAAIEGAIAVLEQRVDFLGDGHRQRLEALIRREDKL
jgi:hypothetical protein